MENKTPTKLCSARRGQFIGIVLYFISFALCLIRIENAGPAPNTNDSDRVKAIEKIRGGDDDDDDGFQLFSCGVVDCIRKSAMLAVVERRSDNANKVEMHRKGVG